MIIRPDYIEAIKPFIDAPLVKILAGVRRCGKSTILEMMTDIISMLSAVTPLRSVMTTALRSCI